LCHCIYFTTSHIKQKSKVSKWQFTQTISYLLMLYIMYMTKTDWNVCLYSVRSVCQGYWVCYVHNLMKWYLSLSIVMLQKKTIYTEYYKSVCACIHRVQMESTAFKVRLAREVCQGSKVIRYVHLQPKPNLNQHPSCFRGFNEDVHIQWMQSYNIMVNNQKVKCRVRTWFCASVVWIWDVDVAFVV